VVEATVAALEVATSEYATNSRKRDMTGSSCEPNALSYNPRIFRRLARWNLVLASEIDLF